jgi:4'-phosphopantetheinyl transferase
MSDRSSLDRAPIRVWYADVADVFAVDGREARAVDQLLEPERARYLRFLHDEDRRMFLLGRVMARAAVGQALGVAPAAWTWCEGPRGRPGIGGCDSRLDFNLAHSGGTVVCAVSPGGLVGVDVESRRRPSLEPALVDRCCAPDEALDVRARGDNWRDRFLQYWTLKESYLKAVGLGISVPLAEVRFTIDPAPRARFTGSLEGADEGWTFALTELGPSHYLAVAAAPDGNHHPPTIEPLPLPDAWLP